MKEPVFNYDEASDTLYISFAPGEKATGIALNDSILLRINKKEHRAVGISIMNYSLLAQKTDVGPRSFPLSGLLELTDELRDSVLDILMRSPVKEILSISTYTPSLTESIPIASLQEAPPELA